MGNPTTIRSRMGGTVAHGAGDEDGVDQMHDIFVTFTKAAADGMASTTTADTLVMVNPYDFALRIVSARLVSASTLTGHDTDFATITIKTDDGANGSPATALTWTTTLTGGGTGSWATDTPESNTARTDANCNWAAGACLHYNIAKAGSGVVVPITIFAIRCRRV